MGLSVILAAAFAFGHRITSWWLITAVAEIVTMSVHSRPALQGDLVILFLMVRVEPSMAVGALDAHRAHLLWLCSYIDERLGLPRRDDLLVGNFFVGRELLVAIIVSVQIQDFATSGVKLVVLAVHDVHKAITLGATHVGVAHCLAPVWGGRFL